MAKKDDLIKKATELGVSLTGEEKSDKLEEMIKEIDPTFVYKPNTSNDGPKDPSPENTEKMIPLSQVKLLIAEAMSNQAEKDNPKKVKKVTEHHARAYRLNGKWVVNFADRNYDYEKKQIIDPYIKEKIHAYNLFNQQKREFEAWIKVIFEDGTTEELPLNRYIERRTGIYCLITKREKVDKSYSIGEVEKKKEVGDLNVGTGIMVDQEVEMFGEVFHLKTPDGKELVLPDYVVC